MEERTKDTAGEEWLERAYRPVLQLLGKDGAWLDCRKMVIKQFELLREMAWGQQACGVQAAYLLKLVSKLKEPQKLKECFCQLNNELQCVGSRAYERLFDASEDGAFTEEQAKKRLHLLVLHLGAELDENEMLQLNGPYAFDETLSPHARFWQTLAKTMQAAYPNKNLSDPIHHQLRMYIDRQNIQYIRSKFKTAERTDEQALAAYVSAPSPLGRSGKRMEREPARYHNKMIIGETYGSRVLGNENKKRTVHFHSEFILNRRGDFVSQWNVLEKDKASGKYHSDLSYYQTRFGEQSLYFEEQLMNGESFNYAEKNDKVHKRLDVRPPGKLDHNLRKTIGRHGLNGQKSKTDMNQLMDGAEGQQRKWLSPQQRNRQNPELNYDYFSDKGDTYSGNVYNRLLDTVRRLARIVKK
ncbi:DUF3114 domain-containing protein [Enterococcus sp. BWR-S5]|uniref:DUF3114 domain-containing protein n=1 Tax=Enterococcus sp. BWR-S5 TaxID=2787714 RepID=UPI001920B50E|nr:DUF3114 domain-containing protein [Enterococcus sp. BWR-S5]MBL1226923.1 DUF3114 domain-containing protein [Enterococcus sp. BWR-S5]